MSYINIREIVPGDAEILAHLQSASWRSGFAGILEDSILKQRTDIVRLTAMYARALTGNFGHGILLELEGKPHCMAIWDKAREDWFDGAELICIHSLPEHWQEGYGSRVMERVLKDMKEAGYKRVMLWVFEENTRARRFYEKHGFHVTEHTKTERGPVEILYEREL